MKLKEILKLTEAVRLPEGKKGLLICDIDDCLLKADPSGIGVWKNKPGEKPIRLSTEQFAKDPDAATHKEWFDYREFRDSQLVFNSIVKGTPLLKNLRLLDAHVRANFDISFLTARGLQNVVDRALRAFLMVRTKDGKLIPIGDNLKSDISAAVNDEKFCKIYPNMSDAQKKAEVLKKLCGQYDIVKYIDDDMKNINAAKALKIPNLQVITAQASVK